MPEIRKVCIVGGKRNTVCALKPITLVLVYKSLVTAPIKEVVKTYNLNGEVLGEVMLGAVSKHAADFNLAREAVMDSGLSPHTLTDLQKACGTF